MAGYHHTKKLKTYRSLYRVNHHFHAIVRDCRILEKAGFMPMAKMKVFRGLVRELQSLLSHDVADQMHDLEDKDSFKYGKGRIAWEHYLNPDLPPFRDQRLNSENAAAGKNK